MGFRLLGGTAVPAGGVPLDAGSHRQRCVPAALAVDVGRVVPVDRLVDRVWGEDPPPRARDALMSHLSRLRRVAAGLDGVGREPATRRVLAGG